jgi:protein SCO1/2
MMRLAMSLGLMLAAAPAGAMDPASFQQLSFRQHPGAQLPDDARLVDATGRPVTLRDALDGRPAVFVLEYLHCKSLCSLVLNGAVHAIASARLKPGRDVDLVAVSFDPRDNPTDARAAQEMYGRRLGYPGGTGVRFFTGSPAEVHKIASAVGFRYRYDKASDQFAHPAGFVVTTPQGRIARYMLGLNPAPAQLRQAVAEAALERVEPPAHPLLCLCFGYDPDEGSVSALTWQLVRIASFTLLLAIAALIAFLSFQRRAA